MKSIAGGTNTSWYLFKPYQYQILENTHSCGYLQRDPCWGPIKSGRNIEMCCRCVNRTCKEFLSHRREALSEEEYLQFDPSELSCIDEYGYETAKKIGGLFERLPGNCTIESEEEENTKPIVVQRTDEQHIDTSVWEKPVEKPLAEPVIEIEEVDAGSTEDEKTSIFSSFVKAEQADIIEAEPDELIFIDAGPGTGKTYTLIQKLNYMVTEMDVDPESILVLCFTNAAVSVIKERLREFVNTGAHRSLVNIDVRTFHSFSWWLISQANELFSEQGWKSVGLQTLTYDTSLIVAERIMRQYGDTVVEGWSHFIVDEVQDLTNNLAKFVLTIVNTCVRNKCGVTVLGDACQAIYDYTQYDARESFSSDDFYRSLFSVMDGKAKFLFLSKNHRQGKELIEQTQGLRQAILDGDVSRMAEAVCTLAEKIEVEKIPKKTIGQKDLDQLRGKGSICLLFRNNGQTLKMSSDLRKHDVPHTLNVKETDANFAPWIADVFCDYSKPTISFDAFASRFAKSQSDFDADVIWSGINQMLHTDDEVLNVREILDAIAYSRIDAPFFRVNQETDVVVSNIHRAKGKEYDCVVVDQEFVENLKKDGCRADEYKTLYVAITRPRKKLLMADLQGKTALSIIKIFDSNRKRWGQVKNKAIKFFEFSAATDLAPEAFVNANRAAFSGIAVGDALSLVRKIDKNVVSYEIIHEDSEAVIGEICGAYIEDLKSYMRIDSASLIKLPATITDLYVSGVYSQVVDSEWLDTHPSIKKNAINGVWKWVDIIGAGHMNYDVY